MRSFSSNLYAQLRTRRTTDWTLAEPIPCRPTERLLQSIWAHQRLNLENLLTNDGESIKILHPGFWNCEAGPDFTQAIVRVGSRKALEGDIEIDVVTGGWKAHGHDINPDFCNVVLHVVWESTSTTGPSLPTLELKPVLDAPLAELSELLDGVLPPPLSSEQQGKCRGPLKQIPTNQLESLLNSAACVRLDLHASQLRARAKQVGWDQSLIEGMFGALGYKNNTWPMRRLGELNPTVRKQINGSDPMHWQVLLLGLAGMIPAELNDQHRETGVYLKKVWNVWWREQDRFNDLILPKSLWKLRSLRPSNHPQRRLALAAHWLSEPTLVDRITRWFSEIPDTPTNSLALHRDQLLKTLTPNDDDFWQNHWTLQSAKTTRPQPLIGAGRVTDLAINVILPWFLIRATEGKNIAWKNKAERLWLHWPKSEDNAVLRHARGRLLENAGPKILRTAAHQQGLIQIVRDYCDRSNAICNDCQFPDLVNEWRSQNS